MSKKIQIAISTIVHTIVDAFEAKDISEMVSSEIGKGLTQHKRTLKVGGVLFTVANKIGADIIAIRATNNTDRHLHLGLRVDNAVSIIKGSKEEHSIVRFIHKAVQVYSKIEKTPDLKESDKLEVLAKIESIERYIIHNFNVSKITALIFRNNGRKVYRKNITIGTNNIVVCNRYSDDIIKVYDKMNPDQNVLDIEAKKTTELGKELVDYIEKIMNKKPLKNITARIKYRKTKKRLTPRAIANHEYCSGVLRTHTQNRLINLSKGIAFERVVTNCLSDLNTILAKGNNEFKLNTPFEQTYEILSVDLMKERLEDFIYIMETFRPKSLVKSDIYFSKKEVLVSLKRDTKALLKTINDTK